jgi:hypothetical protein
MEANAFTPLCFPYGPYSGHDGSALEQRLMLLHSTKLLRSLTGRCCSVCRLVSSAS